MSYIYVPDEDLPDELYETCARLGDKFGLLVDATLKSGPCASDLFCNLNEKLNEAARYGIACIEKALASGEEG